MGSAHRFSEGGIVGRWADKTRLTVDVPAGSYSYLSRMVDEVNARTKDGDRRMTLSRLVRGPIGTLLASERRVGGRVVQPSPSLVKVPSAEVAGEEPLVRLTCDMSRGSYAQLWRIVHSRNGALVGTLGTVGPRITISDLVRAQIGSMMAAHRKGQLPRQRRVRA